MSRPKTGPTAHLAVDCRCALGEGIIWHRARESWYWLDIHQARLWSHCPGTSTTSNWRLPDRAGAFVFAASGQVVVGLTKQLVIGSADRANGEELVLAPLIAVEPDQPTLRINDGRTDRAGNFVFGTMNEARDGAPIGSVFQFSATHGLRRLDLGAFAIANSICFNPEGDRIYFCDSPTRRIMQAVYDAERAAISDIRVFHELTNRSLPDGSVIDAAGRLWNAEWDGYAVGCYMPDGRLADVVRLPVPHVTCPAFGGAELTTLAVTTARTEMTDEDLEKMPTAGGLFAVDGLDGVVGLPDTPLTGL